MSKPNKMMPCDQDNCDLGWLSSCQFLRIARQKYPKVAISALPRDFSRQARPGATITYRYRGELAHFNHIYFILRWSLARIHSVKTI
jgi:hypothetical protein